MNPKNKMKRKIEKMTNYENKLVNKIFNELVQKEKNSRQYMNNFFDETHSTNGWNVDTTQKLLELRGKCDALQEVLLLVMRIRDGE